MPSISLSQFRTGAIPKTIAVTTIGFFLWTFFISTTANALEVRHQQALQKQAQLDAMYETGPEATLAYRLQKLKDKITHDIPDQQANQSFWDKTRSALGAKPISTSQLDEINAIAISISAAE